MLRVTIGALAALLLAAGPARATMVQTEPIGDGLGITITGTDGVQDVRIIGQETRPSRTSRARTTTTRRRSRGRRPRSSSRISPAATTTTRTRSTPTAATPLVVVEAGNGNDIAELSDAGGNVNGGAGDDTISGGLGFAQLDGGPGSRRRRARVGRPRPRRRPRRPSHRS